MIRSRSASKFWTVPAAALGLAAVSWWALRPSPPSDKRGDNSLPVVEATGARSIVVRENGKKAWEFGAQRITIDADRIHARAEGIANGVIFRDGAPLWRMRAARVELDQLSRDVDARDAVASLASNGLRIESPRVVWKHAQKKLVCPEPIRATMNNVKVSAKAASYDAARGELRCASGVEVTSSFGTLSAPVAVASPSKRIVTFTGGVDILIRRDALPAQVRR